jgi:YgiT-type zinc finger domain-containing protein
MMQSEFQSKGNAEVVCDVCGFAAARVRRVPRSYGKGETLLVIEDVPVVSCPNCGSSYLTAAVMKEIDRIKQGRDEATEMRALSVAVFP